MATPYISVEHVGGVEVAADHASKAAAVKYAGPRRKDGAAVFIYEAAEARRLGLDPRKRGSV